MPEKPWQALDDETLQTYFQALAESTPEPDPERLNRVRRAYLLLARALRPESRAAWRPGRFLAWSRVSWTRWAVAAAMVFLLLWFTGAATVRAAQNALPGSPLYPLKRWQETWLLMRAQDPQTRARLHQTFARRRIQELRDLLAQGRAVPAEVLLENLLLHVDALSALAQTQAAPGTSPELLGEVATLLPAAQEPYRTALLRAVNALLQGRRLVGILQRRQADVWQVDQVQVRLTPMTLIQGLPQPGDVVEVVGDPVDDKTWQARWVRVVAHLGGASPVEVTVVGELSRTDDGRWRVGEFVFEPQSPAVLQNLSEDTLVEARLRWDPRREGWIAVSLRPKAVLTGQVQEVEGRVEALEGNRLRVNGQWWVITQETTIEGRLYVGALVELEAWRDPQGVWHVVEIEVEGQEEEGEEEEESRRGTLLAFVSPTIDWV